MKRAIVLLGISFIITSNYSQITHLETYYNGQGDGIKEISNPDDIEIDSIGNIYIVGDSKLTHIFSYDSLSQFSFVEKQGASTNAGLYNVDEIKSTSNGKYFYLTGDNELLAYYKIDSTGKLTLRQRVKNSDSIVIGYAGSTNIAISPDSKNLFLSVYDYAFKYAINVFSIDSFTGELEFKSQISDMKNINSITCNDTFVYTTSTGYYDTSLCVFRRSNNFDSITLIQKLSIKDSILDPSQPVLSPDNKFLYVYDSRTILIFNINEATGKLTFNDRIVIANYYNDFWFAQDIQISSDNKNLYIADEYGILVFLRDVNTGKLNFIQAIQEEINGFTGFSSVSSIVFSKSGSEIIALSKYNNSFIVFKRDKETGELTYIKTVKNGDGIIKGLSESNDILISKNGKHIYTLAYGGTNSIALFTRQQDGRLKFYKNFFWDELGPEIGATWLFKINPNDSFMYISSTNMYGLRILKRNPFTGNLTYFKSYINTALNIGSEIIKDFEITKDGKNLYTLTHSNIITYQINSDSSDLTFTNKNILIESGAGGLIGSSSLISSNDGKNIYTFTFSDFYTDGISVFSRNQIDGRLVHIENYTEGDYTFTNNPFVFTLSPDDNYLYGAGGSSIVCFRRNLTDGRLTFLYELKNTDIGIDETFNFKQILIGNNGKSLHGIKNDNKTVISFYRSIKDGMLKSEQIHRFSFNTMYSSYYAKAAITKDTKNMYIISQDDQALFAFECNIPLGLDNIINGCEGETLKLQVDDGYNYHWSTGDTLNQIFITLNGNYIVQVKDTLNRTGIDSSSVIFHPLPEVILTIDTIMSDNETTYILSNVLNGNYPINYLWNDSSQASVLIVNISNLSNGNYTYYLQVIDKYGCKGFNSIDLLIDISSILNKNINENILIYPNPAKDYIVVDFYNLHIDDFNIKVYNLRGEIVGFYAHFKNKIKVDLSQLSSGIYIFEIYNDSFKKRIMITKH